MKRIIGSLFTIVTLWSCGAETPREVKKEASLPIIGTWKLVTGTTIEKGDTVVASYTKNVSFIKVINDTHFAFLQHDLKKGKDYSVTYSSGGGTYSLKDSLYTEHLEYCSDRPWEGNDFKFTIKITGDTLIQTGHEKVERAKVDRLNIEKYVRVK